MKRRNQRVIAILLASILLFTDCVSGFAAETDTVSETSTETEELNELEFLEGNREITLTESMQEEFSQEPEIEEEPAQVLFEVEELREQSEKSYRLSDGTILAAQYGMDVHYEDENGAWAEIDNRFLYEEAEDTDDFDGYRSAEGAVEFKFAPQVQEGELLKISHEDYEVGFELLTFENEENTETEDALELTENAASVWEQESDILRVEENEFEENITGIFHAPITFLQGEVLNPEEIPAELAAVPAVMDIEDAPEVVWAEVSPGTPEEEEAELLESIKAEDAVTSVGYGNVLPGVSLQYVLSGSSLKEYILVNERSEIYSYDFGMNLGNLEPEQQEDGSLILKDAESGTPVYEIPAGFMMDAEGEYSDAVSMSVVEQEDGSWILNVTADAEWINAEERAFPVQIDPTLNKLHNSLDNIRACYVAEGYPDTQYENPQLFSVGYEPGEQETRTYIQLRNLPKLPKDSVVCGAFSYLRIVNYRNAALPTMHVTVKEVTGATSWSTKFKWKSQPSISSTVMDHKPVCVSDAETYIGWNITELVKKHYKNGNAGGSVSAFVLEGYDAENMDAYYRAKVQMFLTNSLGYPIIQIVNDGVKM